MTQGLGAARYVVPLADPAALERPRVGGKAASLAAMIAEGLRVPPGFAVTGDACRLFLADERLGAHLEEALAGGEGAAGRIAALAELVPVPGAVADAVRASYADLERELGVSDPAVAVRSSAVAEDAETASFAGEFESYLWVSGADAVLDAIRRCWQSLFSERALEYQARHGVDPADNPMAVAVHLMVDAKAAGVMFTLNPVDGDPSRICVEASWGLGVAVVNGDVTPDQFIVDKVTMEIVGRRIGDKTVRYGPPAAGAGTGDLSQADVDPELRRAPCLTDDEVGELARLGLQLHKAERRAQDIEWAIDARLEAPDNLFLLQRRPETVHSQRQKSKVLPGSDVTQWITGRLTGSRKVAR
jgi:pyruvate,water dikinase